MVTMATTSNHANNGYNVLPWLQYILWVTIVTDLIILPDWEEHYNYCTAEEKNVNVAEYKHGKSQRNKWVE